jgi:hypothetical protein
MSPRIINIHAINREEFIDLQKQKMIILRHIKPEISLCKHMDLLMMKNWFKMYAQILGRLVGDGQAIFFSINL